MNKYDSYINKILMESTDSPEEYGYNLKTDPRVANVNWNETDVQILDVWNEKTIKDFLNLPSYAVIYRTLADIYDLDENIGNSDDYDWSELSQRRSYPPPIVITRKINDSIIINDGNHRISFWRDMGKEYIPSWCYDEKITKWLEKTNGVSEEK